MHIDYDLSTMSHMNRVGEMDNKVVCENCDNTMMRIRNHILLATLSSIHSKVFFHDVLRWSKGGV
jgi:hypothetical protein